MARTKLVIFDCDGVLVDSEPLAALAYTRIYARHGLEITTDLITRCVGMKQEDIIAKIEDLTGHVLPPNASSELWPEIRQLFSERLKPTDGIVSFLEGSIFPRCVASSSSLERINSSLSLTGLSNFFGQAIFSSSMVKHGKPAPDIFLHAADKMNTLAGSCVVIEDSPLGVQGAVAAGMTTIGYVGGGHSYQGHAQKLSAAGAVAICSNWIDVQEKLSILQSGQELETQL